jgi:hypothetical protein
VKISFEYRHISGGRITFLSVFTIYVGIYDMIAYMIEVFPTPSAIIDLITISKDKKSNRFSAHCNLIINFAEINK